MKYYQMTRSIANYLFTSLILCIVITYYIHGCNDTYGKSLLDSSNCIVGRATNDMPQVITVRTISNECYNKCHNYCAQYFKMNVEPIELDAGSGSKQNADEKTNLQQIVVDIKDVNKDHISQCLTSCYSNGKDSNGNQFNANVRVPMQKKNNGDVENDDGKKPYPWSCEIGQNDNRLLKAKDASELSCDVNDSKTTYQISETPCTAQQLQDSFYDGLVSVAANDKIYIKLASSDNYRDIRYDVIPSNEIYMCGFKTVFFTPAFVDMYNKTHGDGIDPRSKVKVPTGIYIRDGDYLNIQYTGRYHSNCRLSTSFECTYNASDYNLQFGTDNGELLYDVNPMPYSSYDQTNAWWRENSERLEEQLKKEADLEQQLLKDNKVHGLSTTLARTHYPKIFTTQFIPDGKPNPDSDNRIRSYAISGNIEDFTSKRKQLFLWYPNANNSSVGGYYVTVTWRGCRYQNGERLQYTVFNDAMLQSKHFNSYLANDAIWLDVWDEKNFSLRPKMRELRVGQLEIPEKCNDVINKNKKRGKIYFRIKTLSEDEKDSANVDIVRSNTIGQYALHVSVVQESHGSLFDNEINKFSGLLSSIPKQIFTGLVDSDGTRIIRALLVLYIAFTGLSFMIGLAPITQQEGMMRIIKISIVLMLTSNNSWEFFNKYLLGFFNEKTMLGLSNIFTEFLYDTKDTCSSDNNRYRLLCLMGNDLQNTIFSETFWSRIGGLLLSGLFVYAIVIVVGIIMYAIVMVKIVILFCLAMLGITIVLSLAPIFISLILFKYTKGIFDAWIKQLLVFLMQPIFVCLAISLFRNIFIYLVDVTMGFMACKICVFKLELPFWSHCFCSLYMPVTLAHAPSVSSSVMVQLSNMLGMLIVGFSMYKFYDFAASMAQMLINFKSMGVTDGGMGSVMSTYYDAKSMYNVITAPIDVLAIDDASRAARKQARAERRKRD